MKGVNHNYDSPITVSFLGQKGGGGKTTCALNVARCLTLRDLKVLLVDNDPQGSSRDWNTENEGSLFPVVGLDRPTIATDLMAIKKGYDFVIIDGAPQVMKLSASAAKASDIILIPVQPSPYDIWACSDLVEIIKARQEINEGFPKAAFLISRVIKNTKLSSEIKEALDEYQLPVLDSFTTQRVVYPMAASEGKTVFEHKLNDGVREINQIVDEIFERFICVN